MSTSDRSIQAYLALQPLVQKIAMLKQLQTVVEKYLPSPLCEHCYVANWRENTLVIETDSAVWKTQLLYLAPTFREHLRNEPLLTNLDSIKFSIRPPSAPREISRKQVHLSKQGEETLTKLIEKVK